MVVNIIVEFREAIVCGLRRLHHLRIDELKGRVRRPLLGNGDFAGDGRLGFGIGDEPAELQILRNHIEQRGRQEAAEAVPQLASGGSPVAVGTFVLGNKDIPLFKAQPYFPKTQARTSAAVLVKEGPLVGVIFRVSKIDRRCRHLMLFEVAQAHRGVAGHVDLLSRLNPLIGFFLWEEEIAARARGFAPLVGIAPSGQATNLQIIGDKETITQIAPDVAVEGGILFKHGHIPLQIGRQLPVNRLGIRQGGIGLGRALKAG